MARTVILGNSGLTVGLDESGLVHDFYYPYVGLENLTTARNKAHHVGVWVDGQFSWVNSEDWQKDINVHDDALVSDITMTNTTLKVGLHFQDFVDCNNDIFARRVRVRNLDSRKRQIRVFFHQIFHISAMGRADTAMYVPVDNYILDYKGRCSILAYAETESGVTFDQYAVGSAGIEGKEGTFRDAEDGELSMSAVEHAGVDSTLRVVLDVEAGGSEVIHYWLAVADSQIQLENLHEKMLGEGFLIRLQATLESWHGWLQTSESKLSAVDKKYIPMIKKSLLVIKAHTDSHGGIIASCDSSIYNYGRDYYSYVWPRDGAFVMWPLIKLGYTVEPKKFFEFCKSILHKDGYLMHKYQPDRAIGSTWHPLIHNNRKELAIQEDETAIIVFMLGEFLKHTGDNEFIDSMYESFIVPASNFMSGFIDEETGLPHASYDLWEEKFLTSTYTTAITCLALSVASEFAEARGDKLNSDKWLSASNLIKSNSYKLFDNERKMFVKGYLLVNSEMKFDKTLDISSFFGSFMFNYFDKQTDLTDTENSIENLLLDISPSGGTSRYENDKYFVSNPAYQGNPWFVTTLWMAQYYALTGRKEKSIHYIDWAIKNSLQSGMLSEQISPEESKVIGVTPLVWSHAELINTILDV
jgi:GH15 family glucan-1,4-alpha-glucosidase